MKEFQPDELRALVNECNAGRVHPVQIVHSRAQDLYNELRASKADAVQMLLGRVSRAELSLRLVRTGERSPSTDRAIQSLYVQRARRLADEPSAAYDMLREALTDKRLAPRQRVVLMNDGVVRVCGNDIPKSGMNDVCYRNVVYMDAYSVTHETMIRGHWLPRRDNEWFDVRLLNPIHP